MLGAIAGDIIGSVHEFSHNEKLDFVLFPPAAAPTDDSILTCALAAACLSPVCDYGAELIRAFNLAQARPCAGTIQPGWGAGFADWAADKGPMGRKSYGNGAAMRVSPIAWAYTKKAEVLREARLSALPSHAHPQGIRGAQATALAIWTARLTRDPQAVRRAVKKFYDPLPTLDYIRKHHRYNETCQGCVPEAIVIACAAPDFETAIRWACSIRGDADTLAAIAGSIAEGLYGIPLPIAAEAERRLTRCYPWAAASLTAARQRWCI